MAAKGTALSPDAVERLMSQYWYYAIELAPGKITDGHRYPNVALTRDLLSRADIAGAKCLDIGTMEGLVPVLLKRRGAARVVATDGYDFSEKLSAVKSVYGVDFTYLPNTLTSAIPSLLETIVMSEAAQSEFLRGARPQHGFDIVVCSGVLYHVYSPIHLIGHLRSALRVGGLLVLETAAIPLDAFVLQYNYAGTGYVLGPTDTWLPSVPLIDHLLRFFKFLPLDACWTNITEGMIRFGCVARAVEDRPTLPNEVLMAQSAANLEYAAILREPPPRTEPSMPIQYEVPSIRPEYRPGVGSCDLMATVRRRPSMAVDARMVELHLDDTI